MDGLIVSELSSVKHHKCARSESRMDKRRTWWRIRVINYRFTSNAIYRFNLKNKETESGRHHIYIYIYIYVWWRCLEWTDNGLWCRGEHTKSDFSTALLDCQTDSTNLNECTWELPWDLLENENCFEDYPKVPFEAETKKTVLKDD